MKHVELKQGWLREEIEATKAEIAAWPERLKKRRVSQYEQRQRNVRVSPQPLETGK